MNDFKKIVIGLMTVFDDTTKLKKQRIRKAFEHLDKDKSGGLSKKEFRQFFRKNSKLRKEL